MKARWLIAFGCMGLCVTVGYVGLSLYSLVAFLRRPQAGFVQHFDLVRELKKKENDPRSIASGLQLALSSQLQEPERHYDDEKDLSPQQRDLRDMHERLRYLAENDAYEARTLIVDEMLAKHQDSLETVRSIIEDEIYRTKSAGENSEQAEIYLVRIHGEYLGTEPTTDDALKVSEQAILNARATRVASTIYENFKNTYPKAARALRMSLEEKGVLLRVF